MLKTRTNKEEILKLRLFVIGLLKELKNTYTYKELSNLLNLQETLICRYVNGTTVPSEVQALDLLNKLKNKEFITNILKDKITIYNDGFVDTSKLLFYPNLLRLLAEIYIEKYLDITDITKVLTIASNGISFATLIASSINKPLIISKKFKDSIYINYIEESLKESEGVVSNLYVRRDYISKNDKVLIVDDIIRTGKTVNAAINLTKKGGGKVIGVLVIATVSNDWKKNLNDSIPVISLFSL